MQFEFNWRRGFIVGTTTRYVQVLWRHLDINLGPNERGTKNRRIIWGTRFPLGLDLKA